MQECWDGIIRVGAVADSSCRHIYVNVTWRSLGLLMLFYALIRSAERAVRVVARAETQGRALLGAYCAGNAYALFYSVHSLFIYLNDSWYHLLSTQVMLSVTEYAAFHAILSVCACPHTDKSSRTRWLLLGASSCLCYHALFNVLMEATTFEAYSAAKLLRNVFLIPPDLLALALLLRRARSLRVPAFARVTISGGAALLIFHCLLIVLEGARYT